MFRKQRLFKSRQRSRHSNTARGTMARTKKVTPGSSDGADIRSFFGGGAKKTTKKPSDIRSFMAKKDTKDDEEQPEAKKPKTEGRLRRHVDADDDDDDSLFGEENVAPKTTKAVNDAKKEDDEPKKKKAKDDDEPAPKKKSARKEDDEEEAVPTKKTKKEDEKEEAPAAKKQKTEEEWPDSKVPFAAVAECCGKVEKITGRLEITSIVRAFCEEVMERAPDDVACVLYLLGNKVAPAYENVELGIGDALLVKAIATSCGRSDKQVKADAAATGDLGEVAEAARKKQRTISFAKKPPRLTAQKVLDEFRAIAKTSGNKSQDVKVGKISKLLTAATPPEAKYIVRALGGKMRIHLGEMGLLVAFAHAAANGEVTKDQVVKEDEKKDDAMDIDEDDEKAASFTQLELQWTGAKRLSKEQRLEAAVDVVKTCFAECPSYDLLAEAVRTTPLHRWKSVCALGPGVPVKPMCAKAEKDVRAVLTRFPVPVGFTCEYKYDGERLQAHRAADGSVRLFSRNCADTTKKWPDVVEYVAKAANEVTGSFILDAEVVAIDKATGDLVPFQILSTRKREVEKIDDIEVQVVVFAFDLLFVNGKPLLRSTLRERREHLMASFTEIPKDFQFASKVDVESDEEDDDARAQAVQEAMEQAVQAKVEGLMIKTLDKNATYEPQKRSLNWLKLKKDYLTDFAGDSFDLVVVGGYRGKGKRTGALGSYLLACYDPDDGTFQTVCKIATGFSDADLKTLDELFKDKILDARPRTVLVADALAQDIIWLDPVSVFEIRAADITLSSTHKGALGRVAPGRGIGLRFPRFDRLRTDKAATDATSSDQVLDAYLQQDQKGPSGKNGDDDASDDDGFL